MLTIYELESNAVEELKDRLESEDVTEISDTIHEVADNQVPVYYRQLLEIALSDSSLAVSEPEI